MSEHPARSKLLVYLFSLFPGAGHMYLGLMNRGAQLMLLFFGTLFVSNLIGHPLSDLWPTVIAPVAWFYSFFDSLQAAGKLSRGEPVEDRPVPYLAFATNLQWGKTAGWVILGLGLLALVNNLGFEFPTLSLWVRRLIGPVMLMGIGLWLLWRERRDIEQQREQESESAAVSSRQPATQVIDEAKGQEAAAGDSQDQESLGAESQLGTESEEGNHV